MKCGSCGAINGSSVRTCDFCATDLYAAASAAGQPQIGTSVVSGVAAPQVTFVKDAVKLIEELNKSPSTGFNWKAFLFPIGYLAGYRADDNAKKVATVILIPTFILSMLMYISDGLSNAFEIVFYVWTIFVSYLIATRTTALARTGQPFDLGRAIGFHFAYFVLYYFILAL